MSSLRRGRRSATRSLPPAINIIALASFSAALSTRALDPVLPHVAEDFGVSIATAAGFAAVFAFIFALVQPVIGAAADLFGKARLMTCAWRCLASPAFSARSRPPSRPVREPHPRRHRLRWRVSGRARPDRRPRCTRQAAGRDRPHAGGFDDRQSARRDRSPAYRRTHRLARRADVLGALGLIAAVAVAAGFRGADADGAAEDRSDGLAAGLPDHLRQPQRPATATRRSSSRAAAYSACFRSSPRCCSISARPRSRSRAS